MDFRIIHNERLGSTNDYALERIAKGEAVEGDVIWTDEQTQGRGHGTSHWESEKGKNLTFSIIFSPRFIEPSKQFVITQMISLAIVRLLEKHLKKRVTIKWPNDIYVENGKIAGILIQNILSGNTIDYSVVGIGLNVNQEHFISDAPNPVSLFRFTGSETPPGELLDELLSITGGLYNKLHNPVFYSGLHELYLEHLFRYREWAEYDSGGKFFRAMITGISDYGQLKLQTVKGEEKLFGFKEIEFVL